jgi:hypothetical protein
MSNISSNFSLVPIANVTTSATPLSLNELLDQLGFEKRQSIINTFVLPPINLIGIITCSFSLWILFRPSFSDPIFFYYRLLCFLNIHSLLFNIPFGILISPFYFPCVNPYAVIVFRAYQIYYRPVSTFLFHFEHVVQMVILLHKMKQFSPLIRNHFRASPKLISFVFFLTCFFIDFPLFFGSKVSPLGDFFILIQMESKKRPFLSHFLMMMCYLYYFIFSSFSNSILIMIAINCIYTLGPFISMFIFYSFNQMFRDETNKKAFCLQPRPSPKIIFISNNVRF